MMLRPFQIGLLAFWSLYFAASALVAAKAALSAAELSGGLPGGIDFTLLLQQLRGVAEFAVAGLFLLALLIRVAGMEEEQADAPLYAGWAASLALVLQALGFLAPALDGEAMPDTLAGLAVAAMLIVSMLSLDLSERNHGSMSEIEREADAASGSAFEKARLAAFTAGLARISRRGPAR